MRISVNGQAFEVSATTLELLLEELGYATATAATALNQQFVRRPDRGEAVLREGDAVEIVTPRQGG
ncbi:MAG: sulfur carrier protein ThiS [Methylocystis sp.]|nr:sulfur carrier protein ThiS [Methylocystis sp.]MBI3276012.1 sulfur carrier protein ThiS [Methylocystis sp.]